MVSRPRGLRWGMGDRLADTEVQDEAEAFGGSCRNASRIRSPVRMTRDDADVELDSDSAGTVDRTDGVDGLRALVPNHCGSA
jgi:hypothetical protein